jgi:hypothetical protein
MTALIKATNLVRDNLESSEPKAPPIPDAGVVAKPADAGVLAKPADTGAAPAVDIEKEFRDLFRSK